MAVHIAKLEEPIPGYRLLERLGRGGFGEVWKAEAPGGLLKAIKFVYGDLTSVGGGGEPAEQELKALNRVKTIRHPYILSLERFELIDGQLVIVMELADGNLWERYRECRAQGLPGIPRDELLRYMEETAEALDLMNHTYQIQHMDIKPQNLLSLHNHIKVADFGLAKDLEGLRATITGGVTPLYAAPETFEGWVSRFSDQYSLAIVYQELLTGRRPFAGANTRQLSLQHLTVMPDLTPLPEGDRPALARALSKKPDDRFPSCGEMVKALRGLGADGRGRSANGGPRGDPNEDTGPELGASTAHLITKAAAMAAAWAPPARPARAERVPGYPPQPAPPRRQPAPPQRTAEPGSLPPLTTQDQLLQYRAEPEGNAPRTRFRPWHGVMTQAAGGVLVPPEQTGSGVLFPALILGLGRTGLNALQQFRHAARDRFGRGVALPHVRLLYIDTDPEAAEAAAVAPPPACLSPEEICLARLNRPKHYLRREGIVPVESWLPNQVLYRLPRNPATLGVRCFGRLALCDNYRVIISRLRQALDTFPRTELLDQAAEQTGLKLRSNRPRVYVVAGLGGGTGGGMFLDLAYLVRRELQLMGYQTPEVIGLFLLPIPSPGLPGQGKGNAPAVANCHAALRELAYFTAPGTAYEFQFDEREPPVYDPERPFRRCVFLSLPEEERPRRVREAADLAAQLLFQEMLSPLGRAADEYRDEFRARHPGTLAAYQSAGVYRLYWPRQRILEKAVERFTRRMLREWVLPPDEDLHDVLSEWVEQEWTRRELDAQALLTRLHEAAQEALEGSASTFFQRLLEPIAGSRAGVIPFSAFRGRKGDAEVAAGSESAQAFAVLDRILEVVGRPETEQDVRPGRLAEAMSEHARNVIADIEKNFEEFIHAIADTPQYRLHAAEAAVGLITAKLKQTLEILDHRGREADAESRELLSQLLARVGALAQHGGRPAGALVKLFEAYPQKRYQAVILQAARGVYRSLLGAAPDLLRDVQFCRARLEELVKTLSENAGQRTRSSSATGRFILPADCRSLEEAADRVLAAISPEDRLAFEEKLRDELARRYGSLVKLCRNSENQISLLRALVEDQAITFLGRHLPPTGSVKMFFRDRTPQEQTADTDIAKAFDEAAPAYLICRDNSEREVCILAAPPGPASQELRDMAAPVLEGVQLLPAESADEIIFYRELQDLGLEDLPQMGPLGVDAYEAARANPAHPPHSRADVKWPAGHDS